MKSRLLIFHRLLAWRQETARAAGLPSFMVAHRAWLRNIAAPRPRTERELLAIKGMAPKKLENYGMELRSKKSQTCEKPGLLPTL